MLILPLFYLKTNYCSLEDALPETDVLYMTRIQRERFETQEEYDKVQTSNLFLYIIISTPIC